LLTFNNAQAHLALYSLNRNFGSAFGSIADYEHYYLTDIVNSIKQNPDDFAEWHASETAKLYETKIFENKKCDKGYWF